MGKRKTKVVKAARGKEKTGRFCMWCGETFYAVRVDATLCSARCRQAMHRWEINRDELPPPGPAREAYYKELYSEEGLELNGKPKATGQ